MVYYSIAVRQVVFVNQGFLMFCVAYFVFTALFVSDFVSSVLARRLPGNWRVSLK